MKTLADYMSLPYPIEIIPDEGGFVALIPDLPGCMSSGTTVDEALKGLEEAKELWLEDKLEDKEPIPEPTALEDYSGKFVLRIPKTLHRSLDYEARKQGTSLNQYLVHLLSERHSLASLQECIVSTVQSSIEDELVHNLGGLNVPRTWSWSEHEKLCELRQAHRPWDLLAVEPKITYVGFGTVRSDIVSMVQHIPQIPERISSSHDPKCKDDYERTRPHQDA